MTNTDAQFTARFPGVTMSSFVANQTDLANWVPTQNSFNTGMMSDIGRVNCYAPDIQESFFSRFMKSPLQRGDSVMSARFSEVTSRAFNPLAPDTDLFNGQRPSMTSNVAKKNFSRQIATEINDYWIKQFVQTKEMISDAQACIMASNLACYRDDMWVSSKAYFGGTVDIQSGQTDQIHIMDTVPTDAGYADEIINTIWSYCQDKFRWKSTRYNKSGFNTKSNNVHIALKKNIEYPAFKKFYADTFNPEFLKVAQTIDYVDDFPTPVVGKPTGSGELIGMIVDDRAWSITPMPDTLTTETFRIPARKSTAFFTTYEYAYQKDPFFNVAYIFAKA